MVDYDLLTSDLADMASALRRDSDLYAGLHRLSITATAALGLDGAGITLRMPLGNTAYVTATDPVTLAVERRQDQLHEGACIDAINTSQIVTVDDLEADPRWPLFAPVLLEAGFHAAAGVPISHQGASIGALNLYANTRHVWTPQEIAAGRLLADMAAGHLINNELLRAMSTLADQLQQALDSRVVIEQAKGMIAGRHDLDPEAAFEVMRGFARSRRRKLHAVAAEIVSGGLDLLDDAKSAT